MRTARFMIFRFIFWKSEGDPRLFFFGLPAGCWVCGPQANALYKSNTGWSAEVCCDKTCESFECRDGYRVVEAAASKVNLTHEECCAWAVFTNGKSLTWCPPVKT